MSSSTNDDEDVDHESLGSMMIHSPHSSMRRTRKLRSMWFPPVTRVEIPQRQPVEEEEEDNAMMMMMMIVMVVVWMVILIIMMMRKRRRKMMMSGCRSRCQLLDGGGGGGGACCWRILMLSLWSIETTFLPTVIVAFTCLGCFDSI
jgi:hypothetical protein